MTQNQYGTMFWASIIGSVFSSALKTSPELPAALIVCAAIYLVGGDISKRIQEKNK